MFCIKSSHLISKAKFTGITQPPLLSDLNTVIVLISYYSSKHNKNIKAVTIVTVNRMILLNLLNYFNFMVVSSP